MSYKKPGLSICAVLLVAACATPPQQAGTLNPPPQAGTPSAPQPGPAPGSGGYLAGDGPGTNAPADIAAIPDALPHYEPLHPYANRQYAALGRLYIPLTVPGSYKVRGIASWYGKKFHGQRTSSGETYDMYGMTAAHPTLPIPSYARVTNLSNNKSVVVRINDRGPFLHDRIIDLSYTAAYKLGVINDGSGEVEVESIVTDARTPAPVAIAEPVVSTPQPREQTHLAAAPEEVAVAAGETATSSFMARAAVSNPELPDLEVSSALVPDSNVYLQLGAFKSRRGADDFLARMRGKLGAIGRQLILFEDGLVRVHLGPYASKDEASTVAEKLKPRLGFKPVLNIH